MIQPTLRVLPPLERAYSLAQARKRAFETLDKMRLQARFQVADGMMFRSTHCCLTDHRGFLVDHGYGKGTDDEANVGAIYEALERWLNKPEQFRPERLPLVPARELADQLCGVVSPTALSTLQGLKLDLHVREYRSLTGSALIHLPAVLSSPWHAEEILGDLPLARYCTNSGVAIGNTEDEAITHGLLEAIEREAISNFLVQVFVHRNASALRRVAPESLSEPLQAMLNFASGHINSTVTIFELISQYQIPVYCASFDNQSALSQLTGFGASLSSEHAVKRALSELVQGYDIVKTFHEQEWLDKIISKKRDLKISRLHTACYEMRIVELAERLQSSFIPFVVTRSFDDVPLREYLDELLGKVQDGDGSAYVGLVAETYNHKVIHAYLAGQSFFYGALEGSLVFPDIEASLERIEECLTHTLYEEKAMEI